MKPINPVILVLLCIITLLYTACNNSVEFTRVIEGRVCLQPDSCFYYEERVLVKNIPQNDVEQSKIMIAYFDSVGLSLNELLKKPEIKYYYMNFYKSTYATRRYFVKMNGIPKKEHDTYNGNETDLGYIYMGRCVGDSTKWKIKIGRNLGTADNYDWQGADIESVFLQNECVPNWDDANKNNDLVKYYMELKNKKL